jgi:hypothetical protein
MVLNGWQRLWLVTAVLLFPLVAWQFTGTLEDKSSTPVVIAAFVTAWAVPVGVLYAGGVVVAWVIKGFRDPIGADRAR